jgi:hypothetical protein
MDIHVAHINPRVRCTVSVVLLSQRYKHKKAGNYSTTKMNWDFLGENYELTLTFLKDTIEFKASLQCLAQRLILYFFIRFLWH